MIAKIHIRLYYASLFVLHIQEKALDRIDLNPKICPVFLTNKVCHITSSYMAYFVTVRNTVQGRLLDLDRWKRLLLNSDESTFRRIVFGDGLTKVAIVL